MVKRASKSRPPSPPPSPRGRTARRFRWTWLATAFCAVLPVLFSLHYVAASLSRSWFYSSDEYVFAGEVIRFLNLNPHQYYFDMPGTPYMILTTVLWAVFRPLAGWMGADFASADATVFVYHHLDWLFTMLRTETLVFYAGSLILLFVLVRRLLNTAAAMTASLVLMMSPIYADYSAFARVESMAMCLVLAALLLVYRALETSADGVGTRASDSPTLRDPMILAGTLAGIAAATRLHSMIASGTLLYLILLCDPRRARRQIYPPWVPRFARFALPLVFAAGAIGYWQVQGLSAEFPYAASLLAKAALALAIAPLLLVVLYTIPRARLLVVRAVNPEAIKLLMGAIAGFLLTNPLMIPEFRNFINSMNFYSGSYIDFDRTTWPLWENIRWYAGFYGGVFAPNTVLLLLFLAGALWIAIARDWRFAPFPITVLTFFISKPINLKAAPHHTILWLPFFAIVCAYPLAKLYRIVRGADSSQSKRRWLAAAASGVAYLVIAAFLTNGPARAQANINATQIRLENIGQATDWIHYNTPSNTTVAFSYGCFNPDVFYTWVRSMHVPVPGATLDTRRDLIWWGRRGELSGYAGYVCTTATGQGQALPHDQLDPADPNHLADPYAEHEYQRVASFGQGTTEVDIFRFDFRRRPDSHGDSSK